MRIPHIVQPSNLAFVGMSFDLAPSVGPPIGTLGAEVLSRVFAEVVRLRVVAIRKDFLTEKTSPFRFLT